MTPRRWSEMPGLRVVGEAVTVMRSPCSVGLVKDYQQGNAREENEEGDQEVAVGDNAFGGLQEAHAAGLSRGGDAVLVSGYVGETVASAWLECQTAARFVAALIGILSAGLSYGGDFRGSAAESFDLMFAGVGPPL